MKKVTGIGGIFFKCKDPVKLKQWYADHLDFDINDYGCVFGSDQNEENTASGDLQWSPFDENTNYFQPSTKEFMINYRVSDIEALVSELKTEGVTILDEIETYDYGKFVHLLDPENNKIELWEPA